MVDTPHKTPISMEASCKAPHTTHSWLSELFYPTFEELPLALMSFSLIVLFFIDSEFRNNLGNLLDGMARGAIPLYLIFLGGMLLSIFHVFSSRKKKVWEKYLMLFFAVVCCFVSGFHGGFYMLKISWKNVYLSIFAILNILQGCLIMFNLLHGRMTDVNVSDRNAPISGVQSNIILLLFLILVLKYLLSLHCIEVFSICAFFSMTFSDFICKKFPPGPRTYG